MPRLEDLDCRDGHGKACRSRPWRIWATVFCTCECHQPLIPWLHRRWLIGWVLEPSLAPVDMRAAAHQWAGRPFEGHTRPCWTFRGAQRLARRWNRGYTAPGIWEVFGPVGKGED